jgi:hypothetical protein
MGFGNNDHPTDPKRAKFMELEIYNCCLGVTGSRKHGFLYKLNVVQSVILAIFEVNEKVCSESVQFFPPIFGLGQPKSLGPDKMKPPSFERKGRRGLQEVV